MYYVRREKSEILCDTNNIQRPAIFYIGKAKLKWELYFWFGDKEIDLRFYLFHRYAISYFPVNYSFSFLRLLAFKGYVLDLSKCYQ